MTSKREEIEARLRDAVREGGGWPNDAALERYIARAVDETIAALAVFEQAHTPTDDERELLAEADALVASWDLKGSWTSESPVGLVMRLAAALRRPVQGEPKHSESCGERCNHCSICGEGILYGSRCPEHYLNQPQGEPTAEEWRASIVDERCRQFTKGYGADHDREHGVEHLLVWAQDYARRGEPLKSAALIEAARELLAAQGEPEWEYRCTGPDGDTPRRFATESEVAWHMKSGCGEVQRRKAGPWLPVPDTTNHESEG